MMDNVGIVNIFDNHDITHKIYTIPKQILASWLKCGFVDCCNKLDPPDVVIPTLEVEGVPQGGPISPTIANMVLRRT